MTSGSIKQLLILGVTLLALQICQAQWPVRYNDSGQNGVDEGVCVAVDRFGNTYTAGKTWTGSTEKYDFLVDSYDSNGVRRAFWPKKYTGPAQGDDVPTSIAVDYDGSVYVAGVSYGGTDTGYDFCVIKLDSAGNFMWPASGGGTGYVYHNGAIRTVIAANVNDNLNEGFVAATGSVPAKYLCAMTLRQSWSSANRIIALTGPAYQFQIGSGGGSAPWRTVVLEPDSANPGQVKLKTGWPVDLALKSDDDKPLAIAVHDDNSVYVAGYTHDVIGAQKYYTVVRYQAAGTAGSSPYYNWKLEEAVLDDKDCEARAIVLDRAGNAYVTGFGTREGLDYYTIRINKNQPTLTAVAEWFRIYSGGNGEDIGRAIDLTYEIDGGEIKPAVHVTGSSAGSGTGLDIATLRYDSDDGTQVRLNRHDGSANADDIGYAIVGAGRNSYVVGKSTRTGTGVDYVMLGYRNDGTTPNRFSPYYYDAGASAGIDEGRGLTMAAAGVVVLTGASTGSSTAFDFLTDRHAQTEYVVPPTTLTVLQGIHDSGTVSDVEFSDGNYLSYRKGLTLSSLDPEIGLAFSAVSPITNASEISIDFEGFASVGGILQEVWIYDCVSGQYELVDSRTATTSARKFHFVIKDDAMKYTDTTSTAGTVKVKVTFKANGPVITNLWYGKIDQLVWHIIGN